MNNCYLCDIPLSASNRSKEHILLNSIGGRLKSNELLCRECNSKFGHSADSELAGQLSFLSGFLQIKREKGENPIIKGGMTKDGKEYHLVDGTKPTMSKPEFIPKPDGYHLAARDEKELTNMLLGLKKKKYPDLDIEEAKKHFKWKEEYLDEFLSYETTIGGALAFKSIVKSAINYYIHTQKDTKQVCHLFDYLKDKKELEIAKHYYPSKPIYKKESNEVIHLIHLVGDKHKKHLYYFIEFFSTYSFLILLSDNYIGKSFTSTYSYDVLKNKEVVKQVKLNLKREEVVEIYRLTKNDYEIITTKLNRVMRIASKIQTDKEISNLTRKSVERVFEKHKDEKVITEQMISELSEDVSHAFVKFMYRGQKKEKKDWLP